MYGSIAGHKTLTAGERAPRREIAAEGDLVILYEGFNAMTAVYLRAGEWIQNRQGSFQHSSFIGKEYGTMVYASKPPGRGRKRAAPARVGWVVLLEPTPNLWMRSLNHRTQILYAADKAQIIMNLELRTGSTVVESGTGSGSLSISLMQAIAPEGHLYTFEFNKTRVEKANKDFESLGVSHLVHVIYRDSVADGFYVEGKHPQGSAPWADAVFLDLPLPEVAARHADNVLKPYGRVCSFSPCIEQVQKTCLALSEMQYTEIRTIECLLDTFDVQENTYEKADFSSGFPKEPNSHHSPSHDEAAPCPTATLATETTTVIETAPYSNARGHTGYLVFARKPIPFVQESNS